MYDVMSRAEIDRYRAYSRSPAWGTNFVEQGRQTLPCDHTLRARWPMNGLTLDVPAAAEAR